MTLFLALVTRAQSTNGLSDSEIQGRQLAREILEQQPDQSLTNSGTIKIIDANGNTSEIPFTFKVIVTPTNWTAIYSAQTTGLPSASTTFLSFTHSKADPAFSNDSKELIMPFAGSDFWAEDLALEFYHWPDQNIIKKEFKGGRGCMVLESINPNPSREVIPGWTHGLTRNRLALSTPRLLIPAANC